MRSTPATRAAVRARGVAEMRSCWRLSVKDPFTLSRRDVRIQPGVLTPGCAAKSIRPKGAVERALSIGDRAICSDELSTAVSGRVTMWI
jgi:hypothetical protein